MVENSRFLCISEFAGLVFFLTLFLLGEEEGKGRMDCRAISICTAFNVAENIEVDRTVDANSKILSDRTHTCEHF